jgi:Fanconi-associated nuclease 1
MDGFVRRLSVPKPDTRTCPPRESDSPRDAERPAKRTRLSKDVQAETDVPKSLLEDNDSSTEDCAGPLLFSAVGSSGDSIDSPALEAGLESTLPEAVSEEAIRDYEATAGTQVANEARGNTPRRGEWVKGRSSIYVDAFNLALDTVLEHEAHLFDGRERHVFEEWRSLAYENQYLYVFVTIQNELRPPWSMGTDTFHSQVCPAFPPQSSYVAQDRSAGVLQRHLGHGPSSHGPAKVEGASHRR